MNQIGGKDPPHNINNKWSKIDIDGMGIRGKQERKKSVRDV